MKHLRKQKNPGLPTSDQADERKDKYRRRRSDRQTNLRRSEEIMIQRKDETPGDSTDTGTPPKENDSSDEAGDFSGDKGTKRQTREETRSRQVEWEGALTYETQNNTCVEMGTRQAEKSSENVDTDCTREHQCGKYKDMENQHEEASSENGTHESSEHSEERSETAYRHLGVSLLAKKLPKQHGTLLYETERLAELSWKREVKDFQSSAREDEKTEGGLDDSGTLTENHEGAQKRKKRESRRDPHRKNLRKSTSPNHFADYRRADKAAPWFSHKEFMEDMEEFINEELEKTTCEDAKAVVGEDDDLLKFAEILYKCSLCTALPCILTSQSAFLSHVREHHLTVRAPGIQCQLCDLHFHTNTDLQTHLSDSHHHQALQENLHTSSFASDEAHDDQELAELENGENSVRSISADYKTEKELSEQSAGVDGGWDDRKNFGQTAADTGDRQRADFCEAESKSTESSTALVRLDTKRPPRSPLATVQYRSSRHLSQLQMLADQAMPQPLTPHQQATTDKARSPMFSSGGGVPEGINGFPSFTPEFGRFTKLIREGGKIVYFCQVCNVKCQVKAAFQVHCNGLRHHNKVNLAAKNKTHRVSPDSPRDVGLRTPLREVSVTGPQVTSSKGDPAFVEKMTKFFHDHPDVSAMVHRNRAASSSSSSSSSFVCPPVSFSFADRSTEDSDSRLGSRLSRTCATSPDKDVHGDRQRCTENSGVSFSPQKEFQPQNQPPSVSRDSGEDADKETSCWVGTSWRSDPKKSGEWITGQDKDDDVHAERLPQAGSLKRAASVATRGDPPALPDSESSSQTRPSSASSVNSSGNALPLSRHGESERCDFGVSGCGGGSGQEPSESKRAKLDAAYSRCHQSRTQDISDKQLSETAGFDQEFSRTTSTGGFFMTKSQTNLPAGCSDAAEAAGSRQTGRERGKCAHVDAESPDVKMTRDSARDSTSAESRISSGRATAVSTAEEKSATANTNTSDSTDAHAGCFLSEQALASVDEEANRRHRSPVYDPTGSRLDSGLLGEDWLSGHDARAVKEELGLWSGAGGGVPDLEDVAMDTSKGQNNEGWKVGKIRDVLRGMLAASNKGSNVSRDVLLHRVSVALQEADVLQWGPACNRAVRELFPHSLAQRKGKFKKTYFFGLSLLPGLEEARVDDPVDCLSYRPLRDMTQDLEQLLEHLPGVLLWSGQVERGVTRDDVLHVLAARLSESEVYQWGMQCNKALRILFPLVLMKRKGKYKTTVYFGVDFTHAAQRLIPTIGATLGQIPWQE